MEQLVQASNELLNKALQERSSLVMGDLHEQVEQGFNKVFKNPIQEVVEYTKAFDNPDFQESDIIVSSEFVSECVNKLEPKLHAAITQARDNILATSKAILSHHNDWRTDIMEGHTIGEIYSPVKTAFLWIPAKKASLISTAIMLVSSAKAAGVKNIMVVSPPTESKTIDPNTIAASKLCGATHFLCGNGLAMIAAASFDALDTPVVDVIYGPGPKIISLAMLKSMAYGKRSQPGVGPSDSLIVANLMNGFTDDDVETLARDLLIESEHGPDSYSYLLSENAELVKSVNKAIGEILLDKKLPRQEMLTELFSTYQVGAVHFDNANGLADFANSFAAEHMLIYDEDEEKYFSNIITNVGEMLIGKFTPFTSANYNIGITAVLPTNGYASTYSGIDVKSFLKTTTVASLSKAAFDNLSEGAIALANAEKLYNHRDGIARRLEK